MMDFYDCAYYIIRDFKEKKFPCLSPDDPEEAVLNRSIERWAVDDIEKYIKMNWYSHDPVQIICDYIDRCKFRYEKYYEKPISKQYYIAKSVGEEILMWFI